MNKTFSTLGLQELLKFPFRDNRAVGKILIAALFLIVGIIPPFIGWLFLLGWYMRVSKSVIENKGLGELPEWDNWGQMILDGLKFVGVALLYFLPVILIFVIGYSLMAIPALTSATRTFDPFFDYTNPEDWAGLVPWMAGPSIGGAIIVWIGSLAAIAVTLFMWPAMLNMIAKGKFGAAFHFSEWWANLKANFLGYLVVYLIVVGTSYLIGSIIGVLSTTIILICLLPFALIAVKLYLFVITFAVLGQVYLEGEQKLATPASSQATVKAVRKPAKK